MENNFGDQYKSEIAIRLREIVIKFGGNKDFATKTGIPLRTLNNYLAANSEPKISFLKTVCDVFGISVEWLVTGCGDLKKNEPLSKSLLNSDLLSEIIGIVEKNCSNRMDMKSLSPEKKAKVIALAYEYCSNSLDKKGKYTEEKVINLLQLAI